MADEACLAASPQALHNKEIIFAWQINLRETGCVFGRCRARACVCVCVCARVCVRVCVMIILKPSHSFETTWKKRLPCPICLYRIGLYAFNYQCFFARV